MDYEDEDVYLYYLSRAKKVVVGRPTEATANALIAIALLLEQANFIRGNY